MKLISLKIFKNKSIRVLIILIFTAEILFFAIFLGCLSYTNGLQTITKSADQISFTVNDSITKMLMSYLEEPQQLEQIHKNVILNNQLDFSNQAQTDKHFVEMLKIFPCVKNTYVALANGHEYGARREDDESFIVWNSDLVRKTLDYYNYDTLSGRQEYIKSIFSYDCCQRPPYLKGLELNKPGWTNIYPSAAGTGLVITAVSPVYTPDNQLLGVIGSSLLLNQIDDYLRALTVTEHSSIFIVEKTEKLIASTDENLDNTKQLGKTTTQISENQNPLFAQSILALKEKVQSLDTLNTDIDLNFNFNGEKMLLHAHPIHEKNNLDWISIILIPEKDLTSYLHDFTTQLLLVTLLACILGILTGIVSARYIIHPLIKVNQLAKKFAKGDFSSKIEIKRQDEIGQLVHTVNEMSSKLEQYFYKLRTKQLRIKLLTAGLETSSNLVVILDTNLAIWWVNSAFEKNSGFTLQEVIGKNIKILLSKQNDPKLILQAKDCLLSQREWHGELIATRKNGLSYVDAVSATPILDDIGETTYYIIVGLDVTEKIKAREALSAAKEARAKAEKIFSIGTMAAGISHEINQPLNSIKVVSGGILYLLKQGEKMDAGEFTDSIQEISNQTDRITTIIKHLRSFTRRDEMQLVPCNINTSIEMSLNIVGKQLSSHAVKVQKHLQEDLPPVLAISTGLEEIIVNLLVNAMQALDTVEQKDKKIAIRTYFSTTVNLEISDNGPGIDPTLEKTLFDSFASTKLNHDGENLGLGLTIVNTIVNSYSGTVKVTANDISGVTFTISLPTVQNCNKEVMK